MASIRLKRVSCELRLGWNLRDCVQALSEIDLEIESGECLTVLGPSGSGKSTLLRVIAGVERCTSGQIWLGDREIQRLSPAARGLALVFQETTLYPDWTVERHLRESVRRPTTGSGVLNREASYGELSGVSGAANGTTSELVASLGLQDLSNRKPHQLSGGERRRVALGRAVVREPAAFLFDEPFSGLDPMLRWRLRSDIRRVLERTKKTAIMVTHDWREATSLPGRTAVLDRGRLKQVGDWQQLRRAPCDLGVAAVVRDVPLNLVPARWDRETGEWDWDEATKPAGDRREAVWAAIDPRAWKLQAWKSQENPQDGMSQATGWVNRSWVSRSGTVTEVSRYGEAWVIGLGALGIALQDAVPEVRLGDIVNVICDREQVMLFARDGDGRLLKAGRE